MVEIYRPDRFRSLSGCSLVAADGSFRVDFHSSFDKVKKAYVAIKHKDTLDVDFNSYRRKGILWMRDFKLNGVDAVAWICQGSLVDYVAWGKDGVGPSGPLHNRAKAAYIWNTTTADYIETGPLDLGLGLTSRSMREGESLGRDGGSNDTRIARTIGHALLAWTRESRHHPFSSLRASPAVLTRPPIQ